MSPVAPSSFRAGRTMVGALAVIILAMAVLWGASVLITNRHNDRVRSESTGGVVNLHEASAILARFEADGKIPMYFPDVSGNGIRGVYLTHEGETSATGWTAFLAQVPGETSSCQWQWDRATDRFDASCDPTRHADASGDGLREFPITVVDGDLHLDLRDNAGTPDSADAPTSGPGLDTGS